MGFLTRASNCFEYAFSNLIAPRATRNLQVPLYPRSGQQLLHVIGETTILPQEKVLSLPNCASTVHETVPAFLFLLETQTKTGTIRLQFVYAGLDISYDQSQRREDVLDSVGKLLTHHTQHAAATFGVEAFWAIGHPADWSL